MKKKVIFSILLISLLCIGAVVFIIAVGVNMDSAMQEINYERINEKTGHCVFNPATIMDDINSGKNNLFISSTEKLELINPSEVDLVAEISIDENRQIVESFFNQYWNDKIDNWNLINVIYIFYDCEKIEKGFYGTEYTFERDNEGSTIIRKIYVLPWSETIQWNEFEESRRANDNEIIWNDIEFSAPDAISLCQEEIIGETFECSSVFVIMGKSAKPIWDIYFYSDIDETIHCTVNAVTGKVKQEK